MRDPSWYFLLMIFIILKWCITIKLSYYWGIIKKETYADRYKFMCNLLRGDEETRRKERMKEKRKTRGKYYMHEIPKGMSEDTLIMNDVINFEEAFK